MIELEWLLAVVFLVGGFNDLFLDLVFYLKPLRRALAQGRENPRCDESELYGLPEQQIAILIPAWDESAVIGAMLESTSDRLDYANYDIFVGTYPNDEATQFEVARAAFDRPRIHRIVCPNPGPTSKADCLNWIVEAIKLKETETGKRYEIFVLEDAEDVVHPLTLKVFNRFVPEYDLIQLPVIPYERALLQFTGNTYLDEFAENHLKTLTSRLAVGGMIPSAGVGTAFSRAACDELAEQTNHVLFPPVSLTEDYDFSFRLFRNHRKSGLAEVWVDRTDARGRHVKELVAIREFFPATFREAVRQKQRWLLGITFQGAQKLGWGTGWRERYMLLRDRIGVATSLFNLIALFIFFRLGELMLEAHLRHQPWTSALPPYHPHSVLSILIDINLLLLVNRLFQRAAFVSQVARSRQAIVAPIRMLWSNVVDFTCAFHATRRFVYSQYTGKPLKWLKTTHEYPNVETLLRRHRPLGDILLERRLISPDQLRQGLALQSRAAFRDRFLGEILVQMPFITQDQLLEALAVQTHSKVALREPVRNDRAIPLVINQIVPSPQTVSKNHAARRPDSGARPVPAPSLFPSQLNPAPAPDRPFIAAAASIPAPAAVPAGIATDPVARTVRALPPTRNFEFAGAAPRPRTIIRKPNIPIPIRPPAELLQPRAIAPLPEPALRPILVSSRSTSITRPASASLSRSPLSPSPLSPSPLSPSRRFQMLHSVASKIKPPAHRVRYIAVIGTRPEAIKLAPVIAELRARAAAARRPDDVFVCITGQHRDMVLEPLALFNIVPDLDLGLMEPGQTLAAIGARVLDSFAQVLAELQPEWVLVQGDTATTAMAALAAFYAGIKVAHIEAGLRTHDLQNPFPEEANRRMVAIVTSMHFAATDAARRNLLREGISESAIHVTGNTGIDALRLHCDRLGLTDNLSSFREAGGPAPNLSSFREAGGPASVSPSPGTPIRVLVTAHRRENLDTGIFDLCQAIRGLVEAYPDRFHFVWPLHPNPRVADVARRTLAGLRDVTLSTAVSYDRLLALLAQCDLVLTDSGGLQEEAPSFGKPVLILRDATERPEGVSAGIARLVGTNPAYIQSAVEDAALHIESERLRRQSSDIPPTTPANPYGDGRAATRIADFFLGLPVHDFTPAAPTAINTPRSPARISGTRPRAALHAIQ